jgi:hypothetical protein
MALAKANLGFPQNISAGTTATVYTVANSKTAYIRGISIHNTSVGTGNESVSQHAQIYVVENSGGSVGVATAGDRIVRVTLAPDDTFVYELQYPVILDTNNDTIQVYNEGTNNSGSATNDINVLVLGDAEE